jgi:hypothetical protein
VKSIAFRPIFMNKIGQGQADTQDRFANNLFLATRGLPKAATGEKARYILQRLADSSRPFGTTLRITGDTAQVVLETTRD